MRASILLQEVYTAPTEEMWRAMRSAPLGSVIRGEDPTVKALEERFATLTNQEAAVFVPTTNMANLIAMMSLCRPGDQVIMESRSHLFWVEQRNVSSLAAAAPRLLRGDHFGEMSLEELERAITDVGYGLRPNTAAIAIENTHNVCGGTCLSPSYVGGVAELAHRHGAAVFCDGARLFNSAVAQNVPVSALTEKLDAVSISLNKGIGAPYGAVLCGSKDLIDRARYHLGSIGGHSVHRAGMFAAAVLVGLEDVATRMSHDHRVARALAEALLSLPGATVDMTTVQTNIVRVDIAGRHAAQEVIDGLAFRGVIAGVLERGAIKFVTHREFDESDIPRVVAALADALSREPSNLSAAAGS